LAPRDSGRPREGRENSPVTGFKKPGFERAEFTKTGIQESDFKTLTSKKWFSIACFPYP
jgi:hypothetical protein